MLQSLRRLLSSLEPGPVPVGKRQAAILRLSEAWDDLSGGDDRAMAPHKVDRAEKLHWSPPHLTFQIERHGGTVLGSCYAEIQPWTVNVDEATAHCDYPTGKRLVAPRQAPFKTDPVAGELAQKIIDGAEDPRLRRTKDGAKVQVRVSKILPPGPRETTVGRAKRLRRDLSAILEHLGWQSAPGGWWKQAGSGCAEVTKR